MNCNSIRLGSGKPLKGHARDRSQGFFINRQLAVKYSFGNQKGKVDDVALRTAAKVNPHSDDFIRRGVQTSEHGLQFRTCLLLAFCTSTFKRLSPFRCET
jgi:hypothetical protein